MEKTMLLGLSFLLFAPMASAGEFTIQQNGAPVWNDDVDGVKVEYNPDNTVKRLSVKQITAVEFPDRRRILKAQKVAALQAEAAIVRFVKRMNTSDETYTDMETNINKSTRSRGNGMDGTQKLNERTVVNELKTTIQSYASGELRGLIVLEKGYDEKNRRGMSDDWDQRENTSSGGEGG
jgi:hypothetical protein